MGHTYTPITAGDRTYTPISTVTPIGTIEEKFTWDYIVPDWDTWAELLMRQHWIDWYFGTAFTDDWTSITTPSKTYSSITKSDRTYTSVTTPSANYSEITK